MLASFTHQVCVCLPFPWIVLCTLINFRIFFSGGHSLFLGLINSLESGAMYTYYYLFISKPTLAQPMKKYIVRWQMVSPIFELQCVLFLLKCICTDLKWDETKFQVTFYMMAIHFGHVLVIPGHDCGYNKYVSAMGVAQSLMMIVLYTKNWSGFVRTKEQRKIEWSHIMNFLGWKSFAKPLDTFQSFL